SHTRRATPDRVEQNPVPRSRDKNDTVIRFLAPRKKEYVRMSKLFSTARKALAGSHDAALARFLQLRAAAKDFLTRKEEGATMVEYGIMVALIAAVSIVIVTVLGQKVCNAFQTLNKS